MIELCNVTRSYGDKVAVAGLDLVVRAGELFAFLGPNGAGKTTTIKMLVGLLRPGGGTIRVCGTDAVASPREANRRLGYVPDEVYLYDKLTGREFLQFLADVYGMPAAEASQAIDAQVRCFELAGFLDDLAESYSHGMRQRLAFAGALLHDPEAIVLDEPMVGLDPRSARLVKDLLRSKARQGRTVFMSTHTLAVAEEIADRIGIIDNGRMLFVGTVASLRERLARHDLSLEHLFLEVTGGNGQGAPAANREAGAREA